MMQNFFLSPADVALIRTEQKVGWIFLFLRVLIIALGDGFFGTVANNTLTKPHCNLCIKKLDH